MTFISPILSNHLTSNSNNLNNAVEQNAQRKKFDVMYEDLTTHANDVSPNKAKARIIKNDPFTYIGNPIRDGLKDVKNFKSAVKDGKISDNNLGRLNDLGIKAGALLIASFLATHSKTKTESIMNFIGGASFVASMSLWTKFFINAPARLIHGFPIGQKYISAQGDKKDFYLDNQFIVWDAMKEDDKRKYAKRAGIDYDAPGGKEKIERKMQKTALQNRTLNLATVGFGAPLMTSLFCNRVEPIIKREVVKQQFNKTKQAIKPGMETYINGLNPLVRNQDEIESLAQQYLNRPLDEDCIKKLTKLLEIGSVKDELKDTDGAKILESFNSYGLDVKLKDLQESTSVVDVQSLCEIIAQKEVHPDNAIIGKTLGKAKSDAEVDDVLLKLLGKKSKENLRLANGATSFKVGEESAQRFIEALKGDYSIANIRQVAQLPEFKELDLNETFLKQAIAKAGVNNEEFFKKVARFNETAVASLRGKLKGYVELVNSVMGSKAESVYTQKYETSIKDLFERFGFEYSSKTSTHTLQALKEGTSDDCIKILSDFFQKQVKDKNYTSAEYLELVKKFAPTEFSDEVKEIASILADPENIKLINESSEEFSGLIRSVLGGKEEQANIHHLISNFIQNKNIDITYLDAKALLALNFEQRVASGEFKKALQGVLKDGDKYEDFLKAARRIVYDGNSSVRNNFAYLSNKSDYDSLIEIIFNKNAYGVEIKEVEGFADIIDGIKNFEGTLTQKFFKTGSFVQNVKTQATRLFNDKTWLRIFAPAAIVVALGTLLIQPLFGNIKKEFDQENKERSAK